MLSIIVEVMPKPEILDPQGKTILKELHSEEAKFVCDVRVGKIFEIAIQEPLTAENKKNIQKIAANILSNSTIENIVSIRYPSQSTK